MDDELMRRCVDMLRSLEFCVDTFQQTGHDTAACPCCAANHVRGLPGRHEPACDLAALLREIEAKEAGEP